MRNKKLHVLYALYGKKLFVLFLFLILNYKHFIITVNQKPCLKNKKMTGCRMEQQSRNQNLSVR